MDTGIIITDTLENLSATHAGDTDYSVNVGSITGQLYFEYVSVEAFSDPFFFCEFDQKAILRACDWKRQTPIDEQILKFKTKHIPITSFYRRSMFSHSGYLPIRVRARIKNKQGKSYETQS